MLILINSFIFLFIGLFWQNLNTRTKTLLSLFFSILISVFYTLFYFNGNDWLIYYLKFKDPGSAFTTFEPAFSILFSFLLYLSLDNFTAAILYYFIICFSLISLFCIKNKCNYFYFIGFLLIALGHNLVLEQLRQFMACIIILYSFMLYRYHRSSCYILIILASLFHTSSIIFLFILPAIRIKNKYFFLCASTILVSLFIGLIQNPSSLFYLIPFIGNKLNFYIDSNKITFNIGYLTTLDILYFIILAILLFNTKKESYILYIKIFIIGCQIHFLSSLIPFFVRVSYYVYFLCFYVFSCFLSSNEASRTQKQSLLFVVCIFISSHFISYFRNSNAPINFSTTTLYLNNLIIDDNVLYNYSLERYRNLQLTNNPSIYNP